MADEGTEKFENSNSLFKMRSLIGTYMSSVMMSHLPVDTSGRTIGERSFFLLAGMLMLVVATPLLAQDAGYILYSAYQRNNNTRVEYCSIARADMRIPDSRIVDRQRSRQLVCERLLKRLKMGIVYPASPGSCPGYSVQAARACLQDGVDLKRSGR